MCEDADQIPAWTGQGDLGARKDMVPEHRHSTVSLREEDIVLHGRDGVHTDILHTMGRMLKRGLVRLE